ncbi:MAG: sulfatase-like hydrolase/transferase, partial [Candidatus Cryptobacteroides sp.]
MNCSSKSLFLLFPSLLGSMSCNSATKNDRQENPNILFLLTDDQSFSTLSAFGNKYTDTPNMDCLVQNGTLFTQAHVMGGLNGAISQPSRAMLITGRHLMGVHKNGSVIPEEEKTFPEIFREAGYTTFGTGKWHSDHKSF